MDTPSLFHERLALLQEQAMDRQWITMSGQLLQDYPGKAPEIVETIEQCLQGRARAGAVQGVLALFARGLAAGYPPQVQEAWDEGERRFVNGVIRRHPQAWKDLLCRPALTSSHRAHEMADYITLLDRAVSTQFESEEIFHALVRDVLDRTAEAAGNPNEPRPFAAWEALVALGRSATPTPSPKWMASWIRACDRQNVMDRGTATKLLQPLLDLGLDINRVTGDGVTVLEARTGRGIFDGFAWGHTIIMTLMDLGADWTRLEQDKVSKKFWQAIQDHPRVIQARLMVVAQQGVDERREERKGPKI